MTEKAAAKQIVQILQQLIKEHPNEPISNHLEGVISKYNGIWGVGNKDLLDTFKEYLEGKEVEGTIQQKDIATIIEEGIHLDSLFDGEAENF